MEGSELQSLRFESPLSQSTILHLPDAQCELAGEVIKEFQEIHVIIKQLKLN